MAFWGYVATVFKKTAPLSDLKGTLEGDVMGFEEKIDVIDLIINVLKDHEKTLDELVSKLEETLAGAVSLPAAAVRTEVRRPRVSVVVRRWAEFRERCTEADIVAFDIEDKQFRVSAVKGGVLFSYQEEMPDMEIRFREKEEKAVIEGIDISSPGLVPTVLRGQLRCGLEVSVKGTELKLPNGGAVYKVIYDIEADTATAWLAGQLQVEKRKVLQGKIQI